MLEFELDGIDQSGQESCGKLIDTIKAKSRGESLARGVGSSKKVIPQAENNSEVLSVALVKNKVVMPDVQSR